MVDVFRLQMHCSKCQHRGWGPEGRERKRLGSPTPFHTPSSVCQITNEQPANPKGFTLLRKIGSKPSPDAPCLRHTLIDKVHSGIIHAKFDVFPTQEAVNIKISTAIAPLR